MTRAVRRWAATSKEWAVGRLLRHGFAEDGGGGAGNREGEMGLCCVALLLQHCGTPLQALHLVFLPPPHAPPVAARSRNLTQD